MQGHAHFGVVLEAASPRAVSGTGTDDDRRRLAGVHAIQGVVFSQRVMESSA